MTFKMVCAFKCKATITLVSCVERLQVQGTKRGPMMTLDEVVMTRERHFGLQRYRQHGFKFG